MELTQEEKDRIIIDEIEREREEAMQRDYEKQLKYGGMKYMEKEKTQRRILEEAERIALEKDIEAMNRYIDDIMVELFGGDQHENNK